MSTQKAFKVGDEVFIAGGSKWVCYVPKRQDQFIGTIDTIVLDGGVYSGQRHFTLKNTLGNWPADSLEHATEENRKKAAEMVEAARLAELPFIIDDLLFTDVRGNEVVPKSFTKEQLIETFERKRKNLNGPTSWATKGFNDGVGTKYSKSTQLLGGDQACHASVWDTSIVGFMLNQFKLDYYEVQKPFDEFQQKSDQWYYEKYLFHPKYSPWKNTIQDFILIRNPKMHNMPIGFLVEGDALAKIDKKMFGNLCIATRHPYEYPMFITSMFNINKYVGYKPISFALSRHINFTKPDMEEVKINPMLMFTGHQHINGNRFARLLKKAPGIVGVKYPMSNACSYYADKEIWEGTSKKDDTSGAALTNAFEELLLKAKVVVRGSRFNKTSALPVTEIAGLGEAIKALVDKYEPDDPANNIEEKDPDGWDDDEYHDDDYDDDYNWREEEEELN